MKKYDIYIKERCLYQSIDEQDFDIIWNTLHHMISLLDTNYTIEDLHYKKASH